MTDAVDMRNKDLIQSVFRKIFLPALLAGASANLAGMIDGIIVGNAIGSDALAAVNACRPAMQIYGFLSEILAAGLGSGIALSIGRNEKENTNRMFTTGVFVSLIVALVLTAVQFVFAQEICRLFANDDALFPMAMEYYRVFLFSAFFILAGEPIAAAMRTDGLPFLSGIVLLLPHILNALLDVFFIYGLGMGLTGAGIATMLGYFAGFLACCYYFFFKKTYRLAVGGAWKNLLSIVSVGMPPAINIGLISVKLLLMNRLALSEGGANGMSIMSLLMIAWALQSLFAGGVKMTMMPMISFYYANGDYHGVRMVFRHAFRILMGLVTVLFVLLEIFPQAIPFLFGMREPALFQDAAVAIRIFAPYLLLESFVMLTITYYTSILKKEVATWLSVLQGLVATVAVIYPMAHFFGLNGVWASFSVSSLISLALIAVISGGSAEGFFKMKGHTYLNECSVERSKIPEVVKSVVQAVSEAGMDKAVAIRTGIAVEEMAVSAFERNQGRKLHIDVTVRKAEDTLLVTFSDDGAEFNPLLSEQEEASLSNLALLKAVSHSVEYGRVIGVNKTDITLR